MPTSTSHCIMHISKVQYFSIIISTLLSNVDDFWSVVTDIMNDIKPKCRYFSATNARPCMVGNWFSASRNGGINRRIFQFLYFLWLIIWQKGYWNCIVVSALVLLQNDIMPLKLCNIASQNSCIHHSTNQIASKYNTTVFKSRLMQPNTIKKLWQSDRYRSG